MTKPLPIIIDTDPGQDDAVAILEALEPDEQAEVLDALPVSCFVKRGGAVRSVGVVSSGTRFAWEEGVAPAVLASAVVALEQRLGAPLTEGYRSELCLALPAWIGSLAGCLERGSMLFVDYGLVRGEYYHAQRSGGTLVCHYRHRAHFDPKSPHCRTICV